ncbi:MAG: His/Gly/Thr/Pro-type tRNA ligase C-terminal domain-containing protein [Gemmatimonadales bacterium]
MAVIGQREADSGQVALRVRGAGRKQEVLPVEELVALVHDRVASRGLTP